MELTRLTSGRRARTAAAVLSLITCLVLLLTAAAPTAAAPAAADDPTLPTVEKFTIANQDILSSPSVVLHTEATVHAPGAVLKSMYVREWAIGHEGAQPNWVITQNSGWVPYQADLTWTLTNHPGVHYLAVAVADTQNKVSLYTKAAADYADLLLPDTQLPKFGMVIYLVSYAKGTPVSVETTAKSGTPWMFAWYPGNTQAPNQWELSSGLKMDFVAPADGTYLFAVFAPDAVTFTTAITPAGGPNILEDVVVVTDGTPPPAGGVYTSSPLQQMSPMEAGYSMPAALESYSIFIPVLRH